MCLFDDVAVFFIYCTFWLGIFVFNTLSSTLGCECDIYPQSKQMPPTSP